MTDNREVRFEDVVGLKSRISWGAVIAGSVVAFAVYLLLTLFFTGLGLSLSEAGVRQGVIGTGAIVCGILSIVVALFCGGCVTTQLTAGETKQEAVIHGVLTWATVTALSLFMVAMGVRAGYTAARGAAYAANATDDRFRPNWEQAARDAGVPQADIDRARQNAQPDNLRRNLQDPQFQDQARNNAMAAAWITLAGTLLAMCSAIGGALAGSGPRFRFLTPGAVRTTEHRQVVIQP
jgi:Kef-type K+ transport system membrane component KefB